jgi:hypothetical protein
VYEVLTPYFKAKDPVSDFMLIPDELIRLHAIQTFVVTNLHIIFANVVLSDLQYLLDKDTGDVLLIDLTEAEILNGEDLYKAQNAVGNYLNEIFTSIPPQYNEFATDLILQEVKQRTNEQIPKYIINILLKYFIDIVVNELYIAP